MTDKPVHRRKKVNGKWMYRGIEIARNEHGNHITPNGEVKGVHGWQFHLLREIDKLLDDTTE